MNTIKNETAKPIPITLEIQLSLALPFYISFALPSFSAANLNAFNPLAFFLVSSALASFSLMSFISVFLGGLLYLFSPFDDYSALLFGFFPMAFLWSTTTELLSKIWQKELLLWGFLSAPLWGLIAYLVQN